MNKINPKIIKKNLFIPLLKLTTEMKLYVLWSLPQSSFKLLIYMRLHILVGNVHIFGS